MIVISKVRSNADYQQNGDNIETLHQHITQRFNSQFTYISDMLKTLSDEEISELHRYILHMARNHANKDAPFDVDIDRLKAFLLLFSNLSEKEDVTKILSYFESTEYGWHNGRYHLNNYCLRQFLYSPKDCCKRKDVISETELAENLLCDIFELFFADEVGQAMLFIFCYCLAALFSSRLNQEGFPVPFFLQIACDKSSVLYQFIEEIIEICDVNSGIFSKCKRLQQWEGFCGYKHQVYYPTQAITQDLDVLCHNRDIPALISGYENERSYHALLRQIVNIAYKKNAFDWKDKFNFLPVFICPEIKSNFDNVFSIDLTGFEISKNRLSLLRERKMILASWSVELVMDAKKYLFLHDLRDQNWGAQIRHRFSSYIGEHTNHVSQQYPTLTQNNAKNVAILSCFFKGYLTVFQKSCTFPMDAEFACFEKNGTPLQQNCEKNIGMLTTRAEQILAQFHQRYLPTPKGTGIKNKDAIRLAKQIEKCYRSLKVSIRVTPVEVKADRYIFSVDTLNETKDSDVKNNIETIQHRLKDYECFRFDFRDPTSIRLIVAEKQLKDNSLTEILRHKDFAESKMKIPYAVGFDELGNMCIEDIDNLKHLLLGGATSTGKSTALMSILMSIAFKHRTGNVNVVVMDLLGKSESDFSIFSNQPFLSSPIITDPATATKAIISLQEEKARRLTLKNMSELPHIVCIIDECPRLFSVFSSKKQEDHIVAVISDLLSNSRHAKIHLILAAQNPVKEYIKGNIANITARMAFRCGHYQNSITILGRSGAEKLVGRGQMIFDTISERNRRIQGSYITQKDMKILLAEIKDDFKQQNPYPFRLNSAGDVNILNESNSDIDEKQAEVIWWALPQSRIANSRIQSKFKVANNRANRLLNKMEEWSVIKKLHGNLGWELIVHCYEDLSEDVINCLMEYGKTEDDIRELLSQNICS